MNIPKREMLLEIGHPRTLVCLDIRRPSASDSTRLRKSMRRRPPKRACQSLGAQEWAPPSDLPLFHKKPLGTQTSNPKGRPSGVDQKSGCAISAKFFENL